MNDCDQTQLLQQTVQAALESRTPLNITGGYALLQPELAARLRDDKLQALETHQPDIIATANIGCLSHLRSAGNQKIVHWIELLV